MIARLMPFAALVALAACQSEPQNALAELDNELLANDSVALANEIMVDPARVNASGKPTRLTGQLRRTPAAVAGAGCPDCKGGAKQALGTMAQAGQATANCAANIQIAPAWAQRLPKDLPMIPNARLVEAGGTSSGSCALRVASFTTDLPLQTALDWYYTRATDAGYTAEHQAEGDDHVLGGTRARDDAAYVVFLKPAKQGGTAIELIANRGA